MEGADSEKYVNHSFQNFQCFSSLKTQKLVFGLSLKITVLNLFAGLPSLISKY